MQNDKMINENDKMISRTVTLNENHERPLRSSHKIFQQAGKLSELSRDFCILFAIALKKPSQSSTQPAPNF